MVRRIVFVLFLTLILVLGVMAATAQQDPDPTQIWTPDPTLAPPVTLDPTFEPTDDMTPAPTDDMTPPPTDDMTPPPTDDITPAPTDDVTTEPTTDPGTGDATAEATDDPATTSGTGIGAMSMGMMMNRMMEQALAHSVLKDVNGNTVGHVLFFEFNENDFGHTMDDDDDHMDDKVFIVAMVMDLPEGFHGFHIHTTGSCEAQDGTPFGAAGEHFNPDGSTHDHHAGDLPSLLVGADGKGYLVVATDRLTVDDLFDEDGSAIVVHANADNHANIPERYGGPDQETLKAGDSGDRIACGVVDEGSMMDDGHMDMDAATSEPTPAG
jgi:superoxide dismutase, Cu-Zn family